MYQVKVYDEDGDEIEVFEVVGEDCADPDSMRLVVYCSNRNNGLTGLRIGHSVLRRKRDCPVLPFPRAGDRHLRLDGCKGYA